MPTMIDVRQRLDGTERFDLALDGTLRPRAQGTLQIERLDGRCEAVPLLVRIDTPIEVAYFAACGIMPYVLEQLAGGADTRQVAKLPEDPERVHGTAGQNA